MAHVADLTVGYDTRQPENKALFPKQSGQVITFFLANGGVITFRTSGTEPKIKFYSERRVPDVPSQRSEIASEWRAIVDQFVAELLKPAKWGITPKPVE